MAGWGRADFEQLKDLQKRIQKLESAGVEAFCERAAKMLAARLLSKVIRRTPVGKYDTGRVGGTLRRGWTAKTHAEADSGRRGNVAQFVDGLEVRRLGKLYQLEIINPVNYASFVEFGHRTRGDSFVPGRFMMTISADEVDGQAQSLLNKEVDKLFKEAFGGN